MLQRIQTIYLIIVVGLLCGFLYMPILDMSFDNTSHLHLKYSDFIGFKDVSIIPLMLRIIQGLTWTLITVNAFTIFIYKKRKLQMNLCILSNILLIVLNVAAVFFIYKIKLSTNFMVTYKVSIIIPFIGSVISFLAYRGIKKDDQLVKSYDRLR